MNGLWFISWLLIPALVSAASYTVTTNQQCENAMAKSAEVGGEYEGRTPAQITQRWVDADCQGLRGRLDAQHTALLMEKVAVTTNAALKQADAALLTGIAPPTMTPISAQSGTVGQLVPPVPIVATDPDAKPLRFLTKNLPPGITLTFQDVAPGGPQLTGTPLNPGAYSVSIRACKFSDCSLFADTSFTWTIVPAP